MWPFLALRAGELSGNSSDTLLLGDQGCTLLTSFNLDGILGGLSADAATLGGWDVSIHTHFRETY